MLFNLFLHKGRSYFIALGFLTFFVNPVSIGPAAAQKTSSPIPRSTPSKSRPISSTSPVLLATPTPTTRPAANTDGAKEKQPWWSYFASGIATVLGNTALAIFAWFQFRRNYDQKEKQFKDDLQQKQTQFEEKTQEDRFKDIQDRFADADDKTRANAALRLAEMAQLPKPDAKGKPVCDENYPFFMRATAPLAIALHMEKDASVRAANKEALANMVIWVRAREESADLLCTLIAKLYDANIIAKRAFITAFAEYCNTQQGTSVEDGQLSENLEWELLSSVASFTGNTQQTKTTLVSMMKTDEFVSGCTIHQKMHGLSLPDLRKMEGVLLSQVKLESARLIDTRDALACALRALPSHINLSEIGISLDHVFLTGAKLTGINLIGAKLSFAHLEGTYLNKAHLENTLLDHAHLEGARLSNTYLQGANLARAELRNAKLTSARLQKAHLRSAHLEGAQLQGANLEGAQLRWTHLEGTRLKGTILESPDGSNKADFASSNWRTADFTDGFSDTEDENLWNWFVKNYGSVREKAELAAVISAKSQTTP